MENKNEVIEIPEVDTWIPTPEETIATYGKTIIYMPIAQVLGLQDAESLNYFTMNSKKCYNSLVMKNHTTHYFNYFERFYDPEHELLAIIARIKFMIDTTKEYNMNNFIYDELVYIFTKRMQEKVRAMVDRNYNLELQYRNITENLQYTDEHAKIMLCISIFMNFCIPLITHFIHSRKLIVDEFIMQNFDQIMHLYSDKADIYSKLNETAYTNISKSVAKNPIIWGQQDIRGKDDVTHTYMSVRDIILNIMPKYTFDRSIISLNFTSIQMNLSRQVLDIQFEYEFVALSSSKRDDDNVSDYDKYESNLIKQSEALYIQSKVNANETMKNLEITFGPFDQWEIDFYLQRLKNDNGSISNRFQQQMVFNLFYKYFGDSVCVYDTNNEDYIKMMLTAKKILLKNNMILLPHIISGKVDKLIGRKSVNKKEMAKMESISYFEQVNKRYRNDKIKKNILSMIATMISSDFSIIDYHNKDLDGRKIITVPDVIMEETLVYTLLI